MNCCICFERIDTCEWCNSPFRINGQILCVSEKNHYCSYECFGKSNGIVLGMVMPSIGNTDSRHYGPKAEPKEANEG